MQRNIILKLFIKLLLFLFTFTLEGCDKNISNNSEFKNIIDKKFVLQRSVFLADSDGIVPRRIYVPGDGSYTPLTIEDFMNYPTSWWEIESYTKKYENMGVNYYHLKNISIIKIHTKIHVSNVFKDANSGTLYVLGNLENEDYNNVTIDLTNLFERHYFDNPKWFLTEDNLLIEMQ